LLISLFAPLHECSHSTAFKSKLLNQLVMFFCGMVHLMPSIWFRGFHMQHHRHTQDIKKDPELGTEHPRTIGSYIFLITGIKIWIDLVNNVFRLFSGNVNESYIDKHNTKKVVLEARIVFVIYLLLFFFSFNLNNGILLYAWIIPMIIGQPFLRLFLLAEHGFCDLTADMTKNSRTTKTNFLVRFFMWNMNYHTEHHSTPGIPFHKLQEYQKKIKYKVKYQELGYFNFHKKYLMRLLNQY
jgi:fatty acid desaturase